MTEKAGVNNVNSGKFGVGGGKQRVEGADFADGGFTKKSTAGADGGGGEAAPDQELNAGH